MNLDQLDKLLPDGEPLLLMWKAVSVALAEAIAEVYGDDQDKLDQLAEVIIRKCLNV